VMIFDSWGGVLADGAFHEFSLAYTRRVLEQLQTERDGARVPSIVFTKGGGLWLEDIAALRPDVIGLDWTVNLGAARARVGDGLALQGNLDPNVLFASPEQIESEAVKVLESFGAPGSSSGHIFNLGHGISQHTPPENVSVLVEMVHAHSRRMRGNAAATA
jgi:uroporphyrinogen decarboxylase